MIHIAENKIKRLIDEGSIFIIGNIHHKLTHQKIDTSVCVCFFPTNVSVLVRLLRAQEGEPFSLGFNLSLGLVHCRQFATSTKVPEFRRSNRSETVDDVFEDHLWGFILDRMYLKFGYVQ